MILLVAAPLLGALASLAALWSFEVLIAAIGTLIGAVVATISASLFLLVPTLREEWQQDRAAGEHDLLDRSF